MALLETSLELAIQLLKYILESAAAVCIFLGLIRTIKLAIALNRGRSVHLPLGQLRLRFGQWLALALEFQLGADVLGTTVAPTFAALGKLGAIALIRTFLNYFLNKELMEVIEMQKQLDANAKTFS